MFDFEYIYWGVFDFLKKYNSLHTKNYLQTKTNFAGAAVFMTVSLIPAYRTSNYFLLETVKISEKPSKPYVRQFYSFNELIVFMSEIKDVEDWTFLSSEPNWTF